MNFLKNIFGVVGNVFGLVGDHLEGKRKEKRIKLESKAKIMEANTEAAIKRAQTGQDADITWEEKSIDHSGWKDEFWTIILATPFILGFMPGLDTYVALGFTAFEAAPVWYQNVLVIVITAPFGVRVAGRGAEVLKQALTKKG